MQDTDALLDQVEAEFPDLVTCLSGPWDDKGEKVWIANFKDPQASFSYVHPGSAASTRGGALAAGIEFLRERKLRMDEREREFRAAHP